MNKKIKVLQLIDSLNVGGAEVLAVNSFNLLTKEKNIESYLCATRKEGKLKVKLQNNKNYFFLSKKRTFDFKAVFKLKKYINTHQIEIIHAHSSSYFLAFLIKIFSPKLKIIWHDHYGKSNFLGNRNVFPLNLCSIFFTHILVVNSKLKNWALGKMYCKKISLIRNFAYFDNSLKLTKLKGKENKRIVCLAAFRPQKDHINLLKSFKLILNDYPDWTLHLVGKGIGDKYEKSIYSFVKENNIKENVFFYGACLDVKNILNQSTIGVLSSNSEGLPISLLEYGLAKLPVVVTNVGECNSVVKSDLYGLIVNPNNYIDLSNGIKDVIENSKFRFRLGEKLNYNVENNFSSDSYIQKLIKIYTISVC